MKRFQYLTALMAVILLLGVAIGPALAQEENPPEGGDSEVVLEGEVTNKISYQGSITMGGNPMTGTPDLVFRLYSDAACTTSVSSSITKLDWPVQDGLFSVELSFSSDYYNGQALWLRTTVNGEVAGCQEILPVPYAHSLKPGATISGTTDELLVLENTMTTSGDYDTLIVRNHSTGGEAVEIGAVNTALYAQSSGGYGVIGVSLAATGAGVLARGADGGTDLILGGNADTTTGDDGVLSSDPAYPSSDIFIFANDGIVLRLDKDGSGEDADFELRDKDNNLLLQIDESGQVTGPAAFPRPAYDSGWVPINTGDDLTWTHSLGGSADDYLVNLDCKSTSAGINNWGVGGDANYDEYYGAWYTNLTNSSIMVHRWTYDTDCDSLRVRIWTYVP